MRTLCTVLIIASVVMVAEATSAGNITLKKSGFGNWKFSNGDTSYVSVGPNCEILRKEMAIDSVAIHELDIYNDLMRVSTVAFMASAGLAVYPIYKVAKGQWKETYWKGVAWSEAALLTSILLERSARSHLTKGVDSYNNRRSNPGSPPTAYIFPSVLNRRTLGVGAAIQF